MNKTLLSFIFVMMLLSVGMVSGINNIMDITIRDKKDNFDYSIDKCKITNADYVLSDPVKVKIRYYDNVTNNGPSIISDETRFAIPSSLPNQEITNNIIFNPNNFEFNEDWWNQKIGFYRRTISVDETSTCYYEIEAVLYGIEYIIHPKNAVGEIPSDILSYYTKDQSKYDITNQTIKDAVTEAVESEENLYWKALKIHDYIINNLEYNYDSGWDPAPQVLEQGYGSATEYTWLFIAMCRAAGIPARYAGGFKCRNEQSGYVDTKGTRWTQIYLPNHEWIPVDVLADEYEDEPKYFGYVGNNHFTTTIGGGPSDYLKWNYNCYDTWNSQRSSSDVDVDREAIWLLFERLNYPPGKPATPVGKTSGKVGESYAYTTMTADRDDGDQIWFKWDWDDGVESDWLGPYNSGETCEAIHTWSEKNDYIIRVKAKDSWNVESEWSDPLEVAMPKNNVFNPFMWLIKQLIQRFPMLDPCLEIALN